jgi:predicted ABC-type ATPase
VNADSIAQGLSHFRPETVEFAAGRVMLRRLRQLAATREDFAFETTLSSRTFAPWLDALRRSSYRVHLAFLSLTSPDLAVARVAERVRQGGHDVPEPVIRRRFISGLRNFFQFYRNASDSWQMFDNSGLSSPQLIASGGGASQLEVVDRQAWQRLMEIQQ